MPRNDNDDTYENNAEKCFIFCFVNLISYFF